MPGRDRRRSRAGGPGPALARLARLAVTGAIAAATGVASLPPPARATTVENPEDPGSDMDPAPPPDAPTEPAPRRGPPLGLNFRVRGGATYEAPAKLDAGGSFDTARTVLDVGARYGFTRDLSAIVSVSYGYDPYGFSEDVRIGGRVPWTELHTLRISAPVFWQVGEHWRLLAVPIVRMQAEAPSEWGDSVTGGGIAAFSYRFGERLRVGPGIGVVSELERRPTIFPVILVDWQITDRLALSTGRGLGASVGPGLQAIYSFSKWWEATLGFRFERTRFRLEPVPGEEVGAIGEDESFPVFATLRVGPPFAFLALLTGAEFRGRLRVDDERGTPIAESAYRPAAFVGFAGQIFF